jgi:MOSC domain-containing protein YiiM
MLDFCAASFRHRIQYLSMRVVSANIGLPREVMWHGRSVSTGIFKEPISGRVALRKLNLDGDRQADLTVHGGEHKAVYCYPSEHYAYWKRELLARQLPFGMFGENFTVDELFEDSLYLGDRFRIGSAEVVVTQPRLPCYKLGIRFADDHMAKRFLASGRSGFYLAVTREGEVGPGDSVTRMARDPHAVSVSDILRLYVAKNYTSADVALIERLTQVAAVPNDLKDFYRSRLIESRSQPSRP